MNILYLGQDDPSSTSYHRAKALERIGNKVEILSPYKVTESMPGFYLKFHYRTGYRFLQKRMNLWVMENLRKKDYDLVWVNGGELFGKECIKNIKKTLDIPLLLYNNDDPTGGRDGRRFDSLLNSIPEYDLCVVMREVNVEEYYTLGAQRVIRVYMSYDEVEHAPLKESEICGRFQSDVSFIGTNIPNENRDKFLIGLIKKGVPVSIWGSRWDRSPYWKDIKPHYRGASLKGKDYIAAVQGSKICLGLLSKGNRDLHTTRSFEIPYIGSALCAERTAEHVALFNENTEAVFWESVEECADKCMELLQSSLKINEIAQNGRQRLLKENRGNEDVVRYILEAIN